MINSLLIGIITLVMWWSLGQIIVIYIIYYNYINKVDIIKMYFNLNRIILNYI